MPPREAAMAVSILLMSGSILGASAGRIAVLSAAQPQPHHAHEPEVLVSGRVERIQGPQLFTITPDDDVGEHELLVFAPNADVSVLPGSRVAVRGALRPCDDTELREAGDCGPFDDRARANSSSRRVLVARSLMTSTRYELTGRSAISFQQEELFEGRRKELPMAVRPDTLASLVDTLAGRSVRLIFARVVGVFDPRVFLVESQTSLLPIVDRNRILVFIEPGRLRVAPTLLVAETVTLSGVARTLLGMQASAEVPWPTALTRDAVKRLDIRAAFLATSVQTPDGVDLIIRSSDFKPTQSTSRPR